MTVSRCSARMRAERLVRERLRECLGSEAGGLMARGRGLLEQPRKRGEVHGLHEMRIETCGSRACAVPFSAPSGHRNDPRPMRRRTCAQPPTYFEAVEARHPEIEQDDVGGEGLGTLERRMPVVLHCG